MHLTLVHACAHAKHIGQAFSNTMLSAGSGYVYISLNMLLIVPSAGCHRGRRIHNGLP